jgi:aspartyl-tRNA(Asn)/glutamyl-tRNA(Gln) amidotransferase subunit A
VLENRAPAAAVALGAAHYALVKRLGGVRVTAGSARGYYIGLAGAGRAAVCILPRGTEEGTTFDLSARPFAVMTNRPVSFALFSSAIRHDPAGALVDLEGSDVHAHAPLATVLRYGKKSRQVELSVALSATFDHVGPLTRSVADAAAVWAVLAGRAIPRIESLPPRSLTLGALGGYFSALLASEVRAAFNEAIARLRASDIAIDPRAVEHTEAIVDTYVNISVPEAAHWHAPTLDTRAADYQPPVRERLERGRTIAAVDYLRAREMREVLTRAVDAALEGCNALVLPTLPIVAPLLGVSDVTMDNGETLTVRAAMLRLTQLFNITGNPAISLPLSTAGLPVGLQLVGRRGETEALLATAAACERVLDRREIA